MLSKSSERKNIKENTSMHETKYLRILERYTSHVSSNDLFQTEIVLRLMNDIMQQLDDFNHIIIILFIIQNILCSMDDK